MDAMSEFDRRDMAEAHAEANEMRANAIRCIEEASDAKFVAWWEQNCTRMDVLAAGDEIPF